MNIVFAGTPEFSVEILKRLNEQFNIIAVFCQSDKPKGRGRKITACAVKEYALLHNLPTYQPEKFNNTENLALFKSLNTDVMVVVAYGQILTKEFLNFPKYGCLNIHTSLLPRWRGAAPIQRAVLAGDSQTGVSIMQMDEGLDTGDLIAKKTCDIESNDTSISLYNKLQKLSANLIVDTLNNIQNLTATKQDEEGITYAKKLTKDEAWIDWSQSSTQINQQIRAFNPYPIAQSLATSDKFQEQIIRIYEAEVLKNKANGEIGSIIGIDNKNIDVITGNGILRITKIQLAGKKPVLTKDFINAYKLEKFILCKSNTDLNY